MKNTDAKKSSEPTADEDEIAGMTWWNGLTEAARAHWLADAKTAVPAEAWAAYKRRTSTTNEYGQEKGS